jgi:hypothetical protein
MNRINESHFSFKCPMSWNDMEATDLGRFCGKCKKEVFDLTNCSINEIRDLEQKNGPICGTIRMAQVATVAISLAAAACEEKKENGPPPVVGIVCMTDEQHEENADVPEGAPEPEVLGQLKVPREDILDHPEAPDPHPAPPSE